MAFLKNYTVIVSLLLVAALSTAWVLSKPDSVSIDSKHWKCTDTEPVGIKAQCTNYAMKDSVKANTLSLRQ